MYWRLSLLLHRSLTDIHEDHPCFYVVRGITGGFFLRRQCLEERTDEVPFLGRMDGWMDGWMDELDWTFFCL